MKVLFAVSNENISAQIVKKYQKEYKEIISYKNMYYFNAIVKELQRDKSYDRIVISEDLEPFANNNYDAIEKFLFEKLDNISDEATGNNGKEIPIILLASDKRIKSEPILVKLFGIGIYNVLLGQDRSTENVCNLLNKPRNKKEAKLYYKIESDEVSYKSESEDNVSETEIKNILNHYRKLGRDEARYVESFNNIAAQYNDAQLRIITKFLPLNVKAVLEEQSPKYQSVMTFGNSASTVELMKKKKEEEGLKIGFLNYTNSKKPSEPVIVPTALKKIAMKKNSDIGTTTKTIDNELEEEILPEFESIESLKEDITLPEIEELQEKTDEPEIKETVKRGRGRPKKIVTVDEKSKINVVKRGRGRPKKIVTEELKVDNDILPGLNESEEEILENNEEQINSLPGFEDIEMDSLLDIDKVEENLLPGFDNVEEDTLPRFDNVEEDTLPGFEELEEENNTLTEIEDVKEDILPDFYEIQDDVSDNLPKEYENSPTKNHFSQDSNISNLLSQDKKIVSFVGTTKNGTSFLVNNLAKTLSSMGIKTAILDLTSNKNAYYIYTKNKEELRNIAYESIKKLRRGITEGISVDKHLDVYTALPGDELPLENVEDIISTLVKSYSIILIDCDFETPSEYFRITQELYIIQTMDILTIQPMTAFLRELKAKEILEPEKIRIVINKEMKVKGLTPKAIIGGLAFYNDPSMSFMTELFNRDMVKYCTIPFDQEVNSKYLESIMDCEIKISGYSKAFNKKLKELANMVYPLLGKNKNNIGYYSDDKFSKNMNNTLEQK